LAGHLLIF
jgi:hypothetical protein